MKLKATKALKQRENRICAGCGKTFTPTRSDGKYCSNACRQRAHREKVKEQSVMGAVGTYFEHLSREIWERVQFLLQDKVKRNVRAGASKPYHRYTGLIKCGDCGSSFVCVTRHWRDKPVRYEYICNGNHRYGNANCTPHRVDETELDRLIYSELMQIKENADKNYCTIEADVKKWLAKKKRRKRKSEL